jgi:hypothetical protein
MNGHGMHVAPGSRICSIITAYTCWRHISHRQHSTSACPNMYVCKRRKREGGVCNRISTTEFTFVQAFS